MASPREELEELRALAAQTPRQELEELRTRALQPAPEIAISETMLEEPARGELGFIEQLTELIPSGAEQAQIARERILEPAATIATGIPATIAGGIAGAVSAPFVGTEEAEDIIKGTQEALTFQPRTEAGRAGLETVGDLMQQGIDIANFPISGLAGLGELITGQGVEQAAETIKAVQERGVGKTLGQRTLEETGNPVAATIAEIVPEAVLLSLGIRKTPKGTPDITPQRAREIEQVLQASQKQGVDVLTSDIFRPKSIFSRMAQQFSERVPIIGVGGKRATQQTQRIEALEVLEQSIPRVEAADIVAGLTTSANKVRVAAGKRISAVAESMDAAGTVPVASTIKRIDKAIEKLSRPGKLESPDLIKDLANLKQTATEAGSSFSSLREFRTDARAIVDKVDIAGRSQLRSTDKALMDNVIGGITKDLDNFVLKSSGERGLSRYKAADRVYAQEATKLTKSRLKTVLDKGDIKPELVNNLLFSSAPSEVKLLFKNLDTSGRQNARMSLYRRALDKATKQGQISPQRFISEVDKLKDNFNVFFRGEAKAELNGLKRLLSETERAGVAGVVTPTGQAMQLPAATFVAGAAATGNMAAIATLLGASTIGMAARAYESAGVRNILIRLGKTPKRSTLEADLIRSMPALLEQAGRVTEQEQQQSEVVSP